MWIGLNRLEDGAFCEGFYEESYSFHKGRKFIDQISDCNLHNLCFVAFITYLKFCFFLMYAYVTVTNNQQNKLIKISEKCPLLRYYAASSDNFLPTFRYNISVSSSGFFFGFLNPEDWTDMLTRIVSNKLPLLAA